MRKFLSILLQVLLIVTLGILMITLIQGIAVGRRSASELAPVLTLLGIVLIIFLFEMKKFWFPILLLIGLTAGLVGPWWWAVVSEGNNVGQVVVAVISGILLLIHLIVWPCRYIGGIDKIAKLRAFQNNVKEAYVYAVKTTQEIDIKAAKVPIPEKVAPGKTVEEIGKIKPENVLAFLPLGDLTYRQLGQEASNRIKELRDRVQWYNETLEAYKCWDANWFSQGFIPEVPSDLKPMDI